MPAGTSAHGRSARPVWTRRRFLRLSLGAATAGSALPLLAACNAAPPPTPQVVEKIVEKPVERVVTQVVEKPVEKVVTQVVEKPVEKQVVVTATPSSRGPITLEVWNQDYPKPLIDDMLRRWNETYPNVKLNYVVVPFADQETKILTGLAGGLTPDSITLHPLRTATYAAKNVTRPIDDYVKTVGLDLADYYALGYLSWQGKLYGLPSGQSPWLYYYNKTVLEKAGVEDPAELYRKDQFTTDKLNEIIAKATKGDGKEKVFGLRPANPSLTVQVAWIHGFGGQVFSEDYKASDLTNPNTVKAVQYMADWSLKGYAPTDADTQGVQGGLTGLFNANRLGFLPRGRAAPDFFKVGDKLGMVPLEIFPGGKRAARDAADGLCIIAKTKYPEEAFDVVRYHATVFNEILVNAGQSIPNRASLAKSPAWTKQLQPWEDARFFELTLQNVKPLVQPPGMAEIDRNYGTAWDKIVLNRASVPEALAEAKSKIDAILKETMK